MSVVEDSSYLLHSASSQLSFECTTHSFETSGMMPHQVPEGLNLCHNLCENLKSCWSAVLLMHTVYWNCEWVWKHVPAQGFGIWWSWDFSCSPEHCHIVYWILTYVYLWILGWVVLQWEETSSWASLPNIPWFWHCDFGYSLLLRGELWRVRVPCCKQSWSGLD